jgi:PAS domain S-box-containing protein
VVRTGAVGPPDRNKPLTHKRPHAGDETLTVIDLASEQDLVSLNRRIRAEAARLGLSPRDTDGLAAAALELGRSLLSGEARATLRVSGKCLDVAYHLSIPAGLHRDAFDRRLTEAVEPLRCLVTDVHLEGRATAIELTLSAELPQFGERQLDAPVPAPTSGDHPPNDSDRAYQDVQAELRDINRGLIDRDVELSVQAAELRQAQDRLRLLLDSAPDYAICTLSPNGEVASWSAGAERIFAYAADEIVGRSFARFYATGDRDVGLPFEHLRRARDRGRQTHECLQVRQDGRSFDAQVALTPLRGDPPGALRGFALIVRDVTERKRLERDLSRRAEELAAANRAKEEFLATLSHELRTPLNAMLGWTRLLRLGKLDRHDASRALETIERNARIQEQLIADILDVSRIVTGRLRLELRPVDVVPVVEAAIDSVRPAADAKGVCLTLDAADAVTVLGDADRLQQVVWNLLVNAIKFTPPEGRVTMTIARDGPGVRMTVSDTGEGVSPDLLPVIFDRFTQGDASSTRPRGGLGLGLSIVRHIVELHGGRVHAYSEGAGRGATFVVHLPVRAIREASVGPPPRTPLLRGVRILIVDDDADAREMVALALAHCGAETVAAASAREALRLLQDFRPDVLISDISMPGEDGYTFIRRVRALRATPLRDVPAVALTAYSRPEDQRRALGAGFQTFVPKPVEVQELAAVVRRLV